MMKFFIALLIFIVIVDPGGLIPGAKEIFFLLTLITGFLSRKSFSKEVVFITITIGLLVPIIGLIVGILANQYFSLEYSLGYFKSFLFALLLLVAYDKGDFIGDMFAKTTLVLVPLTLIIAIVSGPFTGIVDSFFPQANVVVTRRAFGPLLIDPCVFYKTSPLLLFGISYLCSRKQISIPAFILLLGCCVTMFISGTRANIFSTAIILTYFLWNRRIKQNKVLKLLFGCFILIIALFVFPYLIDEVFFNRNEQSLNIKVSLVGSYMAHWREYPLQFLLGSGLGSGLLNERGVSYLLEPTYLELIRYFGLIAFPVILIILVLLPIYYFLKSYGTQQFQKAKYVLVAYLLYIMLEISSNPLLISSTGMIVYVVVLSTAYSCYKIKYYG